MRASLRNSLIGFALLAAADAAAACEDSTRVTGCPPVALYPAIEVEVRSAASGANLASGSSGIVQDGAYIDSLRPDEMHGDTLIGLGAAVGRAGTYDVTVEHSGYEPWHEQGVKVTSNRCSVPNTVRLVARLEPEP